MDYCESEANSVAAREEQAMRKYAPFLRYLGELKAARPSLDFADVVTQAGGAEHVATVTVDVVKGFVSQGPMSSPRVAQIVDPVVRIVSRAWECGVKNLIFTCDNHVAESQEFLAWPSHCIEGSPEAELEDALLQLPFASSYKIIPKPSVSSLVDTTLVEHLTSLPLHTLVLMGDVTDLCLYQLATGLKCVSNARGLGWRLIIPDCAVETYDTPLAVAKELGIVAHDADFIDLVFKYHLQVNGIEVVHDLI